MPVLDAQGKTFDVSVPVLIVGAGACGCSAALAAHEKGVEVMILERDETPRGNTSLSGGQIPAAGTKLQKAAGITDRPEDLANDLIDKAHGECDTELAWHIARESARTVDWLVDNHKLPLECVSDFRYPGHRVTHMHASPSRFGAELLTVFLQAVENQGINLATAAPVSDLYADRSGRVRGVRVTRKDGKTEDIGCDALILASNGFGGNKEMLRKYIPEIVDAHYHGHTGNQGDAIKWGEELGCSLKDLGSYQGHGAVTTPHTIHLGWPSITEGGYQVNSLGKRFSNENAGYSEQAMNVVAQPGHVAWTIFDERCDEVAMQMHSHVLCTEQGAIKTAKDVKELAAIIGCPADVLEKTMQDVAAVARGEKKDEFGRDFSTKPPLKAPFKVAKIMGALFHTQGGLEVDKTGRVLRADGSQMPNLFAGGGAARGLSGPSRWGYLSGSGLLMATNLGRLAGEAAADLVKGK